MLKDEGISVNKRCAFVEVHLYFITLKKMLWKSKLSRAK